MNVSDGSGRRPGLTRRRLLGATVGVVGVGLVGTAATRAQSGPGSLGRSPLLFHSPDLEPYVDELPRPEVLRGENLALAGARARTASTGTCRRR